MRRIECALDEWEDTLSDSFGEDNGFSGHESVLRRSSSLCFCYLTLKLMLKRLAFKVSGPLGFLFASAYSA